MQPSRDQSSVFFRLVIEIESRSINQLFFRGQCNGTERNNWKFDVVAVSFRSVSRFSGSIGPLKENFELFCQNG